MRNAWYWWLAIIIWGVLLFLIKRSFEFGGNPLIFFLIMLALFFVVLFCLRIAILKLRLWWNFFKNGFKRYFQRH